MKIIRGLFDHMVMQRNSACFCEQRFCGETSGEKLISVLLPNGGKETVAKSSADGKYCGFLCALKNGGAYQITISDGDDEIVFSDLPVGDVWMLAGHFNMHGKGLIASAHGGTIMRQWNPGLRNTGGTSLYDAMYERFTQNGSKIAGVLWYQGCSDTSEEEDTESYYMRRTLDLFQAMRKDFENENLPIVFAEFARTMTLYDSAWEKRGGMIRKQQRMIPELTSHCIMLPTEDKVYRNTPILCEAEVSDPVMGEDHFDARDANKAEVSSLQIHKMKSIRTYLEVKRIVGKGDSARFVKWCCLCPQKTDSRILSGSDLDFRLFCDGKEILSGQDIANPIVPDEFSADLTFEEGEQDFVMGFSGKADNARGFCCRFVDSDDILTNQNGKYESDTLPVFIKKNVQGA